MSEILPIYSIVVPAFREADLIGSTLQGLANYLSEQGIKDKTEVIVVAADGGDDTAGIAQSFAEHFMTLRVVQPGARVGKGRDVRAGMQVARGQYVMYMDADLATPLVHLMPLLQQLEAGYDVVIGVRDLWTIHTGLRKYGSFFANVLIRLLATPGIRDTQCGFKGFRADAARRLFAHMTIVGWGFDIELLVLARLAKLHVGTMKLADWHDPKPAGNGLSGDSPIHALLTTLRELLIIKRNRLAGKYKGV
jgi:dolichyl-phosphate beta-glucosyltransferase